MSFRSLAASLLAVALGACSDSAEPESQVLPTPATATASLSLSARILGPVSSDDDADLRVSLVESGGVGARLNFLRLTCANGARQEWGAGKIAAANGSNRIPASRETVFVVHYVCPSSSRPLRLLADLVDANGFTHQVEAAPIHPDWPGA